MIERIWTQENWIENDRPKNEANKKPSNPERKSIAKKNNFEAIDGVKMKESECINICPSGSITSIGWCGTKA
jgi:hypothetical protein